MVKERRYKEDKIIVKNIFKANNDDELKAHIEDVFTTFIINQLKKRAD